MSLNIATSALRTAQLAIDTIGHNLANSTTPGYSRQRVSLSSIGSQFSTSRSIAGGVRVGALERLTDGLLLGRIINQEQSVGYQNAALGSLSQIEALFGEPGPSGLSQRFSDFFGALSSLSAAPDEPSNRNAVLSDGDVLASRFRDLSSSLNRLGNGASDSIRGATRSANDLIAEISNINKQFSQSVGVPDSGYGLLDRQEQLLSELGRFGNIHYSRDDVGRLRVQLAGQEVVSSTDHRNIEARFDTSGVPTLHIEGSSHKLDVDSGRLKGFLDGANGGKEAERRSEVDDLARSLIAEFNRVHATGIPAAGGYQSLRSSYPLVTESGISAGQRPLSELDLPFEILDGQLSVTVVDTTTGEVTQTQIDVDPDQDSLNTLLDKLSAIDGIQARIDTADRLVIDSSPGTVFNFGNSLDPNPDASGAFGSGSAVLGGDQSGPFAFQAGDSFDITVDGTPAVTVTLQANDFADINAATPEELADVINASSVSATAQVVNGQLVLQSNSQGASSTLTVTDQTGNAATTLGIPAVTANGTDSPVEVSVSGSYSGEGNDSFSFRPLQSGTIGLTPGLQVEVLDSQGNFIANLEVGENYSPGDTIEFGNGIEVSFSSGDIEAGTGRSFQVAATASSDTADILVSLGLNSFFTGSDASDIALSQELLDDPSLFAQGLGSASADSQNILRLLAIREKGVEALDNDTIELKYDSIIGRVGQDSARAEASLETESLVLQGLKNRLESVRGVSIDEELLQLERFQQSYQAAARFIQAVNEVTDILFQI